MIDAFGVDRPDLQVSKGRVRDAASRVGYGTALGATTAGAGALAGGYGGTHTAIAHHRSKLARTGEAITGKEINAHILGGAALGAATTGLAGYALGRHLMRRRQQRRDGVIKHDYVVAKGEGARKTGRAAAGTLTAVPAAAGGAVSGALTGSFGSIAHPKVRHFHDIEENWLPNKVPKAARDAKFVQGKAISDLAMHSGALVGAGAAGYAGYRAGSGVVRHFQKPSPKFKGQPPPTKQIRKAIWQEAYHALPGEMPHIARGDAVSVKNLTPLGRRVHRNNLVTARQVRQTLGTEEQRSLRQARGGTFGKVPERSTGKAEHKSNEIIRRGLARMHNNDPNKVEHGLRNIDSYIRGGWLHGKGGVSG